LEISFSEIIDTIRMPERGAHPKNAVITDVEILIACAAMKQVIAVGKGRIRVDQSHTTSLQGFQTLLIGALNGGNLFGRKPLGLYVLVPFLIPIIPQVQKRIKAEAVFGPFSAEPGDLRHFMKIGAQSHSLETDSDPTIYKEFQASHKSGIGTRSAGHPLIGLLGHAID
jgi:hypothetical protein